MRVPRPTRSRMRSVSEDKAKNRPLRGQSFTDVIQRRLDEGISYLERVVDMEVSDERLALLGSAYKRMFMLQNGFFPKARAYLKKAAQYYHKADEELKKRNGDGCYAVLNALSLDLLLGETQAADLLQAAAPLSSTALEQQAHAPADVWMWVQVADILCIRYALNDPDVLLDGVTSQYRRALVLGSSDRVKRSIEDQLHFLAGTLKMRQDQLGIDGKVNSDQYRDLTLQLDRLNEVLQFVRQQSLVSRSITKSMTQRQRSSDNRESAPEPVAAKTGPPKGPRKQPRAMRPSEAARLGAPEERAKAAAKVRAARIAKQQSMSQSIPEDATDEEGKKSALCIVM